MEGMFCVLSGPGTLTRDGCGVGAAARPAMGSEVGVSAVAVTAAVVSRDMEVALPLPLCCGVCTAVTRIHHLPCRMQPDMCVTAQV